MTGSDRTGSEDSKENRSPALADEPEIPVRLVQLHLCDPCLDGTGEECHTPGCSLWMNRPPDLPLRNNQGVTVIDAAQQVAQAVTLPADLDPECRELCEALNLMPGITTTSSCCGHGRTPYRIFFTAESLDDLPAVCWCADRCHSGQEGWRVFVVTDCAMKPPDFVLEGPVGAYAASAEIAELCRTM
jgi:hypothetical protein